MTFNDILPYIAPFGVLFGIFSGVWYRVEAKITAQFKDAKETAVAAAKKGEDAEKALDKFKLEVAKEYASWDTVKEIEARLHDRMDELSKTVMGVPDTIVGRLVEMMRLSNK